MNLVTKLSRFAAITALCLTILMALPIAGVVHADSATDKVLCQGIGAAAGAGSCESKTQSSSNIEHTITYVVDILSIIGGIIAVFMLIYAGLRFVISGGESANIAAAKDTIIYAVVGIIIIAIAQILVHFVLVHIK